MQFDDGPVEIAGVSGFPRALYFSAESGGDSTNLAKAISLMLTAGANPRTMATADREPWQLLAPPGLFF
jgi:hypothetical protein